MMKMDWYGVCVCVCGLWRDEGVRRGYTADQSKHQQTIHARTLTIDRSLPNQTALDNRYNGMILVLFCQSIKLSFMKQ